jgi:hypothetical protein
MVHSWLNIVKRKATSKQQMLKAVYYHSFIVLLGGLQAWRAWVQQQQQKRSMCSR